MVANGIQYHSDYSLYCAQSSHLLYISEMKKIAIYCVMFMCSFTLPDSDNHSYIFGDFTDDYGINYSISSKTWIQYPDYKLDILKIDSSEMYILGYNPSDSTYTKIDYMQFENQSPFTWGFCYTTYDKKDQDEAVSENSADRSSPKSGCNGFPFSRMEPVEGF